MTDATHPAIRWPYLAIGTILGVLWVVQRDIPYGEHMLRTGSALVVIPPIAHLIRHRVHRHRGHSSPTRISLPRLVFAKLALMGVAFALDWVLGELLGHSLLAIDLLLGAGIIATIALLGPLLHPRFVVSSRRAAGVR